MNCEPQKKRVLGRRVGEPYTLIPVHLWLRHSDIVPSNFGDELFSELISRGSPK